jgi:hypothetical protein
MATPSLSGRHLVLIFGSGDNATHADFRQPVTDTVTTVTQPVTSVTQPVTDTVTSVTQPVTDTVPAAPHGRPTSLLFTRRDLDRQFRRV